MASSGNGEKGKGRRLDVAGLESWLWEAACQIRGPLDAPKFKDYILPLIFLKRLSDVFDDEVAHLVETFGGEKKALKLVDQDHGLVRFYVPEKARWSVAARTTTGLGEHLTDAVRAVARENPKLSGVIDVTDFNATAAGNVPVIGATSIIGFHNVANVRGPGVTVVRSGSSAGKALYIATDFWAHNVVLYVKDFHGNHRKFVYYRLLTLGLEKYRGGVAVPTLNRNSFKNLLVPIPPKEEQEKIATIVGAIEGKIAQSERRLAALDALFRSLLHHLMTGKVRVGDVPASTGGGGP